MARKTKPEVGVEMLDEFGSAAERMAQWVSEHAALVIGIGVAILVGAGAYSGYDSWTSKRRDEASDALARVQSEYLTAMGASQGALEVPELANPEAARAIREEYLERFRGVAEQHPGSAAAALAMLEVGRLLEDQGESEETISVWQEAAQSQPGGSSLRAILQQRIGQLHEDQGRWAEAAEAHEAAGQITEFPLRYWALADAARCYARAEQPERALALLEQVDAEAPDLQLPPHMRVLLMELRATPAS